MADFLPWVVDKMRPSATLKLTLPQEVGKRPTGETSRYNKKEIEARKNRKHNNDLDGVIKENKYIGKGKERKKAR